MHQTRAAVDAARAARRAGEEVRADIERRTCEAETVVAKTATHVEAEHHACEAEAVKVSESAGENNDICELEATSGHSTMQIDSCDSPLSLPRGLSHRCGTPSRSPSQRDVSMSPCVDEHHLEVARRRNHEARSCAERLAGERESLMLEVQRLREALIAETEKSKTQAQEVQQLRNRLEAAHSRETSPQIAVHDSQCEHARGMQHDVESDSLRNSLAVAQCNLDEERRAHAETTHLLADSRAEVRNLEASLAASREQVWHLNQERKVSLRKSNASSKRNNCQLLDSTRSITSVSDESFVQKENWHTLRPPHSLDEIIARRSAKDTSSWLLGAWDAAEARRGQSARQSSSALCGGFQSSTQHATGIISPVPSFRAAGAVLRCSSRCSSPPRNVWPLPGASLLHCGAGGHSKETETPSLTSTALGSCEDTVSRHTVPFSGSSVGSAFAENSMDFAGSSSSCTSCTVTPMPRSRSVRDMPAGMSLRSPSWSAHSPPVQTSTRVLSPSGHFATGTAVFRSVSTHQVHALPTVHTPPLPIWQGITVPALASHAVRGQATPSSPRLRGPVACLGAGRPSDISSLDMTSPCNDISSKTRPSTPRGSRDLPMPKVSSAAAVGSAVAAALLQVMSTPQQAQAPPLDENALDQAPQTLKDSTPALPPPRLVSNYSVRAPSSWAVPAHERAPSSARRAACRPSL